MIIAITPATPEDAPALARILIDWAQETPWMPDVYPRAETEALFDRLLATRAVWVARRGGQSVGFVAVDGGGYVDALYLSRVARGQGLGTRLLDRAKAHAPKGLALRVFRQAEDAQRFYTRAGFSNVEGSDGADNDAGLPDIRLEWRG